MSHNWTADEIRRIGYRVVDLIADHLSALAGKPVFQPVPPDRVASLPLDARAAGSGVAGRHPAAVSGHHRAVSVRQRPSALLGLGELAARGDGHLRRGARRGDEPELRRRQPRGDLRRASGDRLVSRHARLPRCVDGTAGQRRLDGDDDGARGRAATSRAASTCASTACAARRAVRVLHVDARRTAARARRSSCSGSAAARCGRSRSTPTTG